MVRPNTITVDEFAQLKKIMDRSASTDQDGEKLAAINAANLILKKRSITWTQVLSRVISVEVEEAPPWDDYEEAPSSAPVKNDTPSSSPVRDAATEQMFQKAFANVRTGTSFHDTVSDIYSKWQRYGSLTDKQRALIKRTAEQEGRR